MTMFLLVSVRLAKDLVHEAQMHKLRHPNIVMLIAVTFERGHYGAIFEFVTYGGLDGFLEDYLVSLFFNFYILLLLYLVYDFII